MIHTKGFNVHYPGDPSAKLAPADWEITGDMEFEDENDIAEFKACIAVAFEVCQTGHAVEVRSFEELGLEKICV